MLFANINNVKVGVVTSSPSVDKYLVFLRRAHFLLHCFTITFNATTCTQRSVISENLLQLDQLITQYLLHSMNCGINAWTTVYYYVLSISDKYPIVCAGHHWNTMLKHCIPVVSSAYCSIIDLKV